MQDESFQHILRVQNTNIDGRRKAVYGLTSIKGIGRRYATMILKKAEVNTTKRAGELTPEEIEKVTDVMNDPLKYKVPLYFLNRRKDNKTGAHSHEISNNLDMKLREDLERLKKIRCERGLRHAWGLRVRGQHTKTTGRKGKTMGVSNKKGG